MFAPSLVSHGWENRDGKGNLVGESTPLPQSPLEEAEGHKDKHL